MDQWNFNNPSQCVKPGDTIVDVNGTNGDAKALLEAMKTSARLEMQIVEGPRTKALEPEPVAEPAYTPPPEQAPEPKAPAEEAKGPLKFLVTLNKGPNDVVGLNVDWGDMDKLRVTKIKEGLIDQWNL